MNTVNARQPMADIEALFLQRWSSRAFSPQPVERDKLLSLLEAARWAPSAGNEQPWLFLWPENPGELERFRSLLNPSNQRWANQAPMLLYLLGRRHWLQSGRPNYTYQFDCGSAFISLALQAVALGLCVHPMAGFDRERAYESLQINKEEYDILIAIAIGYYGDVTQLPEDLQAREQPSQRKELSQLHQRTAPYPGPRQG